MKIGDRRVDINGFELQPEIVLRQVRCIDVNTTFILWEHHVSLFSIGGLAKHMRLSDEGIWWARGWNTPAAYVALS